MNKKLKEKIKEIEKEILTIDANDGIIDIDLGIFDNDFDEIKNYIEKKHKGITMTRIEKRKCVEKNWIEKFKT